MAAHRTYLFAPANHPRKVEKVFDARADAVILDLEDAVANAHKVAARAAVVEAMQRVRPCRGYVRVNALDTPYCYEDLTSVVGPWLDGVVVPKVESAGDLQTVDWLLTQLEARHGMPPGTVDLVPLVETARGIHRLDEICASGTRVRRLAFGAGDYQLDMNLEWTPDEGALDDPRARLARASRAHGLEPPIDTVVIHIRDFDRLKRSALRAREFGFQGKLCIHPTQIDLCNEVFTPSAEEVAHARRVVAAFEAAEADGSAAIALDGFFIDYPIVYRARRVLALLEAIEG